jgi:hypothetical protein
MKFDIRVFFQKSVEKIQVSLQSDMNNGYTSHDPRQCNEQFDKVAKTNKSTEVHGNINTVLLYPKGDGGLGTRNVERVGREGSLECVGTLKNLNSSPQQLTMMYK